MRPRPADPGSRPSASAGPALLLVLLLLAASPAAGATEDGGRGGDAVTESIRRAVEIAGFPPGFQVAGEPFVASEILPGFYEQRLFRPVWIERGSAGVRGGEVLEAVRSARDDGLVPDDYHLGLIEALLAEIGRAGGPARPSLLADLDIVLTDAILLLGTHLLAGRVHPETFDPEWIAAPREARVGDIVLRSLETGDLPAALAELAPRPAGYARLKGALRDYRRMEKEGGWEEIPAGSGLRAGDSGPRVEALRERLRVSGDLPPGETGEGGGFVPELEAAVRSFQERHGLTADGVVGVKTLEALNVPAAARVRQIELNLERWRWLPRDLGARYLVVNIPSFSLSAVEEGKEALSMAVIVGKPYRRTPVFSDVMRYLVFNPYWEIPPSIAVQDLLPQIRKNPAFLTTQGIRVLSGWGSGGAEVPPGSVDWSRVGPGRFPYRLRQDPGPANALGRVKFMFPNKFNVYLHDTPARSLFAGEERALSSGCIRVERPLDLAEWLLKDAPDWSRAAIESAVASGRERTVSLKSPLPVHLEYWTAWAGEDGRTRFRKDLYGRDARLDGALKAARADHREMAEEIAP